MKRRIAIILALVAVSTVLVGAASAQLTLRFAPADTTVEPGTTNRLSIMLDEPVDLRTIDVRVQFDPTVVSSITGGPGALFTDPGYLLFQGFSLEEPGLWWGYSIVLGYEDWVTGPGELYYWEFSADAVGITDIAAVEVFLAAPDATEITDYVFLPTTINVDTVSEADDSTPTLQTGLRCYPNPFNPVTEVRFRLPHTEAVRLSVHDMAGRLVDVLHDGSAPSGPFSAIWDGRDTSGRMQPAGPYLFRLQTPSLNASTRGMLVK